MTRPRVTCCSIVTLAMEFCCCVVSPDIDGPTRKWLMPNSRSMRPPSWLEMASESSAEAPSPLFCPVTERRRGFDVEHGIEAKRIREINVTARDGVLVAAEIHFSRQQVNMAEKNRMLPRPAQAQACIGLKSCTAPLHPRIGTGISLNIELQISQVGR